MGSRENSMVVGKWVKDWEDRNSVGNDKGRNEEVKDGKILR